MTTKILGTSGDVTVCECCGKSNLKRTVVLDMNDVVVHYGTDCAAYTLLGSKSASNNRTVSRRAEAVAYATRLISSGTMRTLQQVGHAVFNRYGYLGSVRDGKLFIGDFAEL